MHLINYKPRNCKMRIWSSQQLQKTYCVIVNFPESPPPPLARSPPSPLPPSFPVSDFQISDTQTCQSVLFALAIYKMFSCENYFSQYRSTFECPDSNPTKSKRYHHVFYPRRIAKQRTALLETERCSDASVYNLSDVQYNNAIPPRLTSGTPLIANLKVLGC